MSLSILSNSAFGFVYVLCFSRRCWLHLPLFSRGGRPRRSGAFGGARLPRLRLLLGDWARCEPLRADVSLGHVTTSPPVAVAGYLLSWTGSGPLKFVWRRPSPQTSDRGRSRR